MVSAALSPRVQTAVSEYGAFWQLWPQFESIHGERRVIGFEVELIASHTSDVKHVDPSCVMCEYVRTVLLGIADLLVQHVSSRNSIAFDIDSHANSILCLPALGNRSAVSVSVYLSWNSGNGYAPEADLLSEIKALLGKCGIHQR
jgi:hypothetical protein